MSFNYVVYKLTFPNGKIYVGIDTQKDGHHINYFGSWSNELVEKDFTDEQLCDFTIRKEILFESTDKEEVRRKEGKYIRELHSNETEIGYNQTCKKRK
ncbi:MAG: GIY-YIG nuclease family protein [Candidatus Paceibacterota bacterium]|jgi:hypothetical protein